MEVARLVGAVERGKDRVPLERVQPACAQNDGPGLVLPATLREDVRQVAVRDVVTGVEGDLYSRKQ